MGRERARESSTPLKITTTSVVQPAAGERLSTEREETPGEVGRREGQERREEEAPRSSGDFIKTSDLWLPGSE